MPEFAGIVSSSLPARSAATQAMLASLRREPAWHSEPIQADSLNAMVGWSDRAGAGFQPLPFWSENRSVCLLLADEDAFAVSGTVASPVATRELAARSQNLVAAYEQVGTDALRDLPGWFSGALLDFRRQTVVLFNDRFGLSRLYYRQTETEFYFGTTAKALLAACSECKRLDAAGLAEWLSCGCVLQNRTLFPDIFILPPGAAWTLHADGRISKRQYFMPDSWLAQGSIAPEEFYRELKDIFPRALARSFRGSHGVAMSLTGGIDGRMIMAWSRKPPGALPCYTFNGPVRDCADVRLAREVARVCGQPFQTIPINGDFFDQFPKLAAQSIRVSDGTMDVTGAAELFLNQRARAIAPIRLTGNYGSEVVRGNVAFRPRCISPELFSPDCVQAAERAAQTYAAEFAGNRLSFVAFKQVPWHHHARFSVERSQLTPRSPFLDPELMALLFRAPEESMRIAEPSMRLIAEGDPRLGRIPTDRGLTYPAGPWTNRVSRQMQEFLAKAEYAYDYGMPDWLACLDRCVAPLHLERLFLGRQKFCHFRSWYRRELAGFVRDVLLDPVVRSRPYLKCNAVETLVSSHLRGTRNGTTEIHKLLSLELIQRELLA